MFTRLEAQSFESCGVEGREKGGVRRRRRNKGMTSAPTRDQIRRISCRAKEEVDAACHADVPFVCVVGIHSGTRQEEVIDHRLTDREWAEEWKHLDHVRKVITFLLLYLMFVFLSAREACVHT